MQQRMSLKSLLKTSTMISLPHSHRQRKSPAICRFSKNVCEVSSVTSRLSRTSKCLSKKDRIPRMMIQTKRKTKRPKRKTNRRKRKTNRRKRKTNRLKRISKLKMTVMTVSNRIGSNLLAFTDASFVKFGCLFHVFALNMPN